jgi:hypothetical protein
MGAEAVKELLARIDLDQLSYDLRTQATTKLLVKEKLKL